MVRSEARFKHHRDGMFALILIRFYSELVMRVDFNFPLKILKISITKLQ
jgi:hypothetical protein